MEETATFPDEHIPTSGQKPYPKRSNVVGLWRKREEAMRSLKEKSGEDDFEEKKEGNHDSENDSRQNHINTPRASLQVIGSEGNAPGQPTDTNSNDNLEEKKIMSASAPRRSTVRESWKKRAASVTSIKPQQSSQNGDTSMEIMVSASDSINSPQSQNSPRGDPFSGAAAVLGTNDYDGLTPDEKSSSIQNSWCKRETLSCTSSTSFQKEENNESEKDVSHTSAHNRITESPSTASASAFDELKSKWAMFGVQKEDGAKFESGPEHKDKSDLSISRKFMQTNNNERSVGSRSKTDSSEKLRSSKNVQEVAKQDAKGSGGLSSRVLASRRMGSKRFRSKYSRKTLSASSMDEIDSENNTTNDSENIKKFPDNAVTSIEKEEIPSFPLDETNQNQSDLERQTIAAKSSEEMNSNLCYSFLPLEPHFRNSSPQNSLLSKEGSIHKGNSTYHEDNMKAALNRSRSWRADVPNTTDESVEIHDQKNSNLSRSSLSSRANRRLRDIRMRNQTREEEDVGNVSKEPDLNVSLGSPYSIGRTKTNESCRSDRMPTISTSANPKLHSTDPVEITTENIPLVDPNVGQRSPLHRVVQDMNEMIPDEFVSEKNASVQSFRTAYDKTTFVQIANDMREEASSVFSANILNEGVQTAINKFGLGDLFQTISPQKLSKRAPSPIEEVAIEVEYVAD